MECVRDMMKDSDLHQQPQGLDLLVEQLKKHYDEQTREVILSGMREKRIVSLRVNPLKSSIEEVKRVLKENRISFEPVSWYEEALIINALESDIEKLSIYEQGHIYLQSLSSMIPALILEPKAKQTILDMAAAPGGKTTQLAALTQDQASITATEAHPIRAEKLKFNVLRQGVKRISILIKDARQLDPYFSFDRILLDAPCSGSGTIFIDQPKSYQYFSAKLIEKSVETQKALLRKAVELLKPGETMVYATCSILPEENEFQIKHILKTGLVELEPIDQHMWDLLPSLPSKVPGTLLIAPNAQFEGFYIAKLKKKIKK
jgi:NOL1/NOP2/sun family putative RNA methylase